MILVTGANGLVGSYLTRYLLRSGEEVRGLRRPKSDLSLLGTDAAKVHWVEGDITDIHSLEDAMDGVDKVYHTAASISFFRKERLQMLKVNAEGTANVVNTALEKGIGRLLHVSGVMTLGKGKQEILLDESEENIDADFDTNYGMSKCLAEMEVWRGMMEGLNAVIINPSRIIGAGRWTSYGPALFPWADRGSPFYMIGAEGFVDVRDVAKVAIELMDSNIDSERFIVSSVNLSFREIIGMIAQNLGRKKPTIPVSPAAMRMFAYLRSIISFPGNSRPLLTPENVHLCSMIYHYNNHKLVERFGYNFIPIEQTIKETCDAYIKSKAEGKKYAILPL